MIPFRIFRNATVSIVLLQQFLMGAVYWAFLYFIPSYLQIAHGMNPLRAAAHMLPWVLPHGVWMTLSGLVMTWRWPLRWPARKKQVSYGPMMWLGYACLALACAGIACTRDVAGLVGLEVVFALDTGAVFQNSVAVLQSHTEQDETAVVLGVRSMVRGVGGSIGSAVGTVIIGGVLGEYLPERWKGLKSSAFSKPPFARMTAEEARLTVGAFEHAIAWVFVACAGAMVLSFALCVFIADHGLERPDIKEKERRMSAEHM